MSHKLPRTLQAVPNTLHARLEIADAIRKVFPTELRKAGFNPDESRVPAGDSKGGQWTTDGGSGSWVNSVVDWFRHTSDPEWAEAQNVQDLVENHPRAALISGSAGLGIALGPAIIALAADAPVVEGFSVAGRVAEFIRAIPAAQQGRITMAVGLAEDASGSRYVLMERASEWGISDKAYCRSILERFGSRVLGTLRRISSISFGKTALTCLKLERHAQFAVCAPH
jgi:hypothetical protein